MRVPAPLVVGEFEISGDPPSPPSPAGTNGVFALLRWNGVPVAQATLRAKDGRIDPKKWSGVLSACERRVRRLGLARALVGPAGGEPASWPSVTVAVCSRDRPDDLAACVTSLLALDYPGNLEILVVDNAPSTDKVERVMASRFPTVRYFREERPGLDWARNRAILEARGEVVAFTDDDCRADRSWARALGLLFGTDPSIGCVTGMVVPAELQFEAQRIFEAFGGFNRGYVRRWYRHDPRSQRRIGRRYAGSGQFGTGANMAFRRDTFAGIGLFDPALDVGTATGGAGDLEMYFRVLKHGFTLVYEPAAIIWHRHRRDMEGLYRQIATWGPGLSAYFARTWRTWPEERAGIVWVSAWIAGNWAKRLAKAILGKEPYPPGLVLREMRGVLLGPRRYARARREADAIARRFGQMPAFAAAPARPPAARCTVTATDGVATIEQSFARDMPDFDGRDAQHLRVVVTADGIPFAHCDIEACGQIVPGVQVADALSHSLSRHTHHEAGRLRIDKPALQERGSLLWPSAPSSDILVSICIATRDRPEDLRRCLTRLCTERHERPVEIVVVDNNPSSGLTAPVVRAFAGVRIVDEQRGGSSYARNAGFAACRGEVIVVTDDDVVVGDRWLERIIAPLARPDVQLVTGNVLPLELTTESQVRFEEYGGLGRGYSPRLFDKAWLRRSRRWVPHTWDIGASANLAIRASWLRNAEVGPFKESLGAGTPAGVGEDTHLFYRTLAAGGCIAYEPRAFVWHRHRHTMESLVQQLRAYSAGHIAFLLVTVLSERDPRGLLRIAIDLPRYHWWRLRSKILGHTEYPWRLIRAEIHGHVVGVSAYVRASARAWRLGRSAPLPPLQPREKVQEPPAAARGSNDA